MAKSKKELMREEDKELMAMQWYSMREYLNDPKEDAVWNKYLNRKRIKSI